MITNPTAPADWIVVLPVVLALLGAALSLVLRTVVRAQLWICVATLAAILIGDSLLFQRAMSAGPLSMTMGNWLPPFGISLAADVLGAAFATIAAFLALVVVLYLQADTPDTARRDGIYPLILLLIAGVSGVFLTGDLFNLYVWFELSLISTFGLLALAGNPLQIDAAVKYGVINLIATAMLLAAIGLLYGLLGTLNMADIIGAAKNADQAALAAIAALFALALATKAAAFPVNTWLPASYHAPPAGIAALIAGLMTKVAAYALIRILIGVLPTTQAVLGPALLVIALLTMLLGPLGAIAETNMRRAVGFLLIGSTGAILAGIAMPSADALSGTILYVTHAMLTITALYFVAGTLEMSDGNRWTSGIMLLLFLSVAGIPPFLGFWPKLLLLRGILGEAGIMDGAPHWPAVLLAGGLLLNAFLTLIAGARIWVRTFWQSPPELRPASPFTTGAIVLLTGTVLLTGLMPQGMIAASIAAATDLLDPVRYITAVGLAP
jgi:multicomponent Na+:H+ antiporter subunit D